MAFIYYPQVDEFMKQRVENYDPNSTEADDIFNKEFVDQLQNSFQCCGWKGLEDFGGIFMSIARVGKWSRSFDQKIIWFFFIFWSDFFFESSFWIF